MSQSQLSFGFFDFAIEEGSGGWIFFECNPNGQWCWIDDLAGAHISEEIASYLAARLQHSGNSKSGHQE
jgi:hypothetical protein